MAITGLNRENKKNKIFLPLFPAERKIPTTDDPGKAAEIRQKVEFFKKFFQTLSDTEKVLVTICPEEYKTAEMAGITGLTEANVRVRIHRLKLKVKKNGSVSMNPDDLKGLTLNDCVNDADGSSTELSFSKDIKKHTAELRKKSFLVIVMLIVIS